MFAGSKLTCPVEASRFVLKVALALHEFTRVSISSLWDFRGSSSCAMGDKTNVFAGGGDAGWGSGIGTEAVTGAGIGTGETMDGELPKSKRSTRESRFGGERVRFLVAATVWFCSCVSSKFSVVLLSCR